MNRTAVTALIAVGQLALVGPIGATAQARRQEQHREFEEQQLRMDEMVNRAFEP